MTDTQVLIVEDEVIVAKHIQSRLKRLGYKQPILAFSAGEALHKADEQPVDLVLMDINLGGNTDGVAAAETIRARFRIPVTLWLYSQTV
ncbi:MAG: response regulator [Chloroflexi bacterium]|nr:response regulator [Chloroflexota bacterium]